MKVAVVGTGYVGLVAGACFADAGSTVFCIDRDLTKIEKLREGIIPIYEPGLETIVKRAVAAKRLFFTTQMQQGVQDADVIFLAVGTPAGDSGEPDLSQLQAASQELGRCLTKSAIIVNKSTVPIGAHEVVAQWIAPHAQVEFEVVSNPEFLKEGSAVEDFLKPDRVVIGTQSDRAFQKMEELYAPFLRQGNPILRMDPISAELTKYACNAFLATRISFMNELSQLCDAVGGDIEQVRKGMSLDVRIGRHFLYAGVGYGGSCFPKDVQALLATARKNRVLLRVVDAAEQANAAQKRRMIALLEKDWGAHGLRDKVIGIWGLAFKPNTDDMREAPSLVIVEELLKRGASIRAFDPVAKDTARAAFLPDWSDSSKITLCTSAHDAARGVDALILVTEWNEFRHVDWQEIRSLMRGEFFYDGRNLFDPAKLKAVGLRYRGIGRC